MGPVARVRDMSELRAITATPMPSWGDERDDPVLTLDFSNALCTPPR
eukprot:CAMPEP_0171211402 /NCGR_PEP_ID=MMETSP0790-20130122/29605_1 /TAXON_ID=2925 /ORGANISM="Alexandrium catenella, Strain OF101" /LENGTH=46 /DNA_ID= /DNA_START= /DNA_END= /DNA_ORIENTATION=